MNRPIIFRGKQLNEEWAYGDLLRIGGGCIIYIGSKTETQTPDIPKESDVAIEFFDNDIAIVIPNTLGQYTNVDDINGNRIFEGDIVRIHEDIGLDNVGVVVFKNGCFGVEYDSYKPKCFHPLYKTKDEWKDMNATIPINITFEVLGNIYDDSQILAN